MANLHMNGKDRKFEDKGINMICEWVEVKAFLYPYSSNSDNIHIHPFDHIVFTVQFVHSFVYENIY